MSGTVLQSGAVTPGNLSVWDGNGIVRDGGPPGSGGGGSGVNVIIGTAPTSTARAPLWWDTVGGNLFVDYNDGVSTQWVIANISVGGNGGGGGGGGGVTLTDGTNTVAGATQITVTGGTVGGTSPFATLTITGGGGGGGNVNNVGTPTSGQIGQWTGATTLSGVPASGLTVGTATVANGLKTATTTVSVSAATAPTTGQVLTATSSTTATWQSGGGGSFLPLTGGTLAGPGNLIVSGSLSANGAIQGNATLGVTGLVAFNFPTVNDFLIHRAGGFRALQWSATDSLSWTESNSFVTFVHSSTPTFSIDPSGNIASAGNCNVGGNGIISGSLSVAGTIQSNATIGSAGLIAVNFPTVNDFFLNRAGGFRFLQWGANDSLAFTESSAQVSFVHSSVVIMSVASTGDFAINGANALKVGGSASWTVVSDERVKSAIEPYDGGLEEIRGLRPITFEYNGEGGTSHLADGKRYHGLSAQAARGVMPELVQALPDDERRLPGQLAIDMGPVTLALVNSVQELSGLITSLGERITALEGGV